MLPENAEEYIVVNKRPDMNAALKEAYANPDDLPGNLVRLGRWWRIDVTFDRPVEIRVSSRKVKRVSRHTFAGFFDSASAGLCYAIRRPLSTGYHFGFVPMVVSYRLVDASTVGGREDRFKDFEAFARRFDRRFITDSYIRKLWDTGSPQHGGQYTPSDFHAIGPKGRRVVGSFLKRFAGLNTPEPGNTWYSPGFEGKGYVLYVEEPADGRMGRDIHVEHKIGVPCIPYASEEPGCGNGRYGVLATEKTFLWVEDD